VGISSPIKISVVTATWNCVDTISDCLDSVATQSWGNIEHVVIDGASTDGTVVVLEARHGAIAVLVSE
jgi:glycosyltransferase